MNYYIRDGKCGTETAFKVLGSKWVPWILHICNANTALSFNRIKSTLPGLSDSTLTRQLDNLVRNEMLNRTEQKEYCLTEKTKDLVPALEKMNDLAYLCGYRAVEFSSAIEYARKIIGNKWQSRILWFLNVQDPARFNTILRSIEGLSHKMLKENLDSFTEYGLVERIDLSSKAPHVEYRLTDKGQFAYSIIDSLADWCIKYDLINPTITISY